jgi:heat shock protein HtpX
MTVKAKPASREEYFDFYTVTENLAIAAGIPKPRLYVVQDKAPNAFATGRDPKHAVVCATSGLLSRLDRGELEGVIAHELAHIKNYDILLMSIVSVLVGTIALVTEWILRIMLRKGVKSRNKNPILLILLILALILSPIAAQLIRFAVSRRREFLADASGALLTRNPAGLASALEKIAKYTQGVDSATTSTAHLFISNPLPREKAANWFQNLFSTHPPIEERIKLLRAM